MSIPVLLSVAERGALLCRPVWNNRHDRRRALLREHTRLTSPAFPTDAERAEAARVRAALNSESLWATDPAAFERSERREMERYASVSSPDAYLTRPPEVGAPG